MKLIFDSFLSQLEDNNKNFIDIISKIDHVNIEVKDKSIAEFLAKKEEFDFKKIIVDNKGGLAHDHYLLEIVDNDIKVTIKYPLENFHYVMVKFSKYSRYQGNDFNIDVINFYFLNKQRGSVLNINTNNNMTLIDEPLTEKPSSRFSYNELKVNTNEITTFFGFDINRKAATQILKNMHIGTFEEFSDFIFLSTEIKIKDNTCLIPFVYLYNEIHKKNNFSNQLKLK